jgi:putative membrane protein
MAEVELGQLALEKASNPNVKEFTQRMVSDHGKANDQLKQLAARKNVPLPSEPSAKNKATKENYPENSSTKRICRTCLRITKRMSPPSRPSTSGQDLDIKQFATETLPTVHPENSVWALAEVIPANEFEDSPSFLLA